MHIELTKKGVGYCRLRTRCEYVTKNTRICGKCSGYIFELRIKMVYNIKFKEGILWIVQSKIFTIYYMHLF